MASLSIQPVENEVNKVNKSPGFCIVLAMAYTDRLLSTLEPSSSKAQTYDYGYVSDYVRVILQVLNFSVICELIDIIGTATNIINIICCVKQGFKDSVNVTLLGLAVSDFGCLATLIWHNICFIPLFQKADLPFDPFDVQYLTAGWPHVTFTRITSWITAFITVERCLCVMVPLKIKSIFTSKRCTIIIICIYVVLIGCVSPIYYSNRLGPKFFPTRNKTIIGLVYTADHQLVDRMMFTVNTLTPFSAFLIVIAATVMLVVKLKSKTAWRKQCTAPGVSDSSSSRDQKVSKMVVVISVMFIICFSPVCIIFIAVTVEPEFNIIGKYRNMYIIMISFAFILESANSALNIVVYCKMSSRYRATFKELFCRHRSADSAFVG